MRNIAYITTAIAALLCACVRDGGTPQPVTRLDMTLQHYADYAPARQAAVLDSLRPQIDAMFAVLGRSSVDVHELEAWSVSPVVEVFQPAVDSVYPDTRRLEGQIGSILRNARDKGLELPQLDYVTVTWGSQRPIVRVDTIMLIALNHYLGEDYDGYAGWPEFKRREKTPAQLPYDLAGVLAATQYPFDGGGSAPTLLDWMLYEGALAEARMQLVDGARAEYALGLTPEQLQLADKNIGRIWEEMAVRKLVYETDPAVIDRYMASAPGTPLLGGTAPGRIGRYVGYRIVEAYLSRHRGTGLQQLLQPAFYRSQSTLVESGFNGR